MVLDALPSPFEFPIGIGNKPDARRFSVSRLSNDFLEYRRVIAAPPHSDSRARIALSCPGIAWSGPDAAKSISSAPMPQVFSPGLVSGPANDGSPALSPDGNTIFFTRSAANWSAIVESHKIRGGSHPTLAPFSGEWSDSSPAMSPDGKYLVFESKRPKLPLASPQKQGGESVPGAVSNLWRVDRMGTGWSKLTRLPDMANLVGQSLWKPSVAANGTSYFVAIDTKGGKRLNSSHYSNGAYQQAQPLSFSDGTTLDVDPDIAPNGSFLVFCSAGRLPDDKKDHLFIVHRTGDVSGQVVPIRYAGDDTNGYSTDDEPYLDPDHRTLYFSSVRSVATHLPRSREPAQRDFEHMGSWGYFTDYFNIWSIPLTPWSDGNSNDHGKANASE
jgi:Tol biopolymer transport system component